MSSPGFDLLLQTEFLHIAESGLSTVRNTKVLVGGFWLRFTPLLVVEADGWSPEDAPAFPHAP